MKTKVIKMSDSEKNFDFCNHFQDIFLSQDFSDVTFKFGNQSVFAHKIILLSRSEFFKKQFLNKTCESDKKIIEIKDCDVNTFKIYLKYLYTRKLDDSEKNASLLALTDKFLDSKLKTEIEQNLLKHITVENSINLFATARKFNCEILETKTRDFIAENFKKVKKMPDFESIGFEGLLSITKVLSKIAKGN